MFEIAGGVMLGGIGLFVLFCIVAANIEDY